MIKTAKIDKLYSLEIHLGWFYISFRCLNGKFILEFTIAN
jgi:hypothetical protein